MSQDYPYSRRKFIRQGAGVGVAMLLTFRSPALQLVKELHKGDGASEPIIDIHQHTNYLGRSNEELIAHQRAMGVTLTILQPAGHPVDYGSTYYGLGNGLQAEATGNEACFELAKE